MASLHLVKSLFPEKSFKRKWIFPTEQYQSSGESWAQAVTLASNAAATHRPEPLVTHKRPARQGVSGPAEQTASPSPCLPCVVLATQKPRYKPPRWLFSGPHTPTFPRKIQVNQWQKQPIVLSHLQQRASLCSQLSVAAHVSLCCHPSFGGNPAAQNSLSTPTSNLMPKNVTHTTTWDKGEWLFAV